MVRRSLSLSLPFGLEPSPDDSVSLIKPMELSYVSSGVLFFSSFTVVVD